MKRVLAVMLAAMMVMTAPVFGTTNGAQITGVTEAMHTPEYWANASTDVAMPNAVLMSTKEIAEINRLALKTEAAKMNDLVNFSTTYDAGKLKNSLSGEAVPKTQYYINKTAINNETYFGIIAKDIERTGYSGQKQIQYAVCTKHADIKSYPTNDILMDSLTDTADEMQLSSLLLNEPFVIKQKCEREGTTFYWGYANNVSGWVDGANLAICKSKAEWLDSWQITDLNAKNFLVVTQDRIITEPSTEKEYPAELHLAMGVRLKLVADKDVPETVGERGTLVNYVVYVPTRDNNGNYVKKMALLGINGSVNIGYLPYTQNNLMKLAYACEGNRYGWGNMLERQDCSGYVRNILRCFGFDFPRNTTWQREIPGTQVDLKGLTKEEKTALLKTLPAGTPIYMPGHAMVYTGTVNEVPYVISATAAFGLPDGELNVVKYLSVVTTPLTVRRGNGSTWLDNIETAVVLQNRTNIKNMKVSAVREADQDLSRAKITLNNGNKTLKRDVDYKVIFPSGASLHKTATVIGTGAYFGIKRVEVEVNGCVGGFIDVSSNAYYAKGVKLCVEKGLMNGTGGDYFSPDNPLTLAQVETILSRMDGKDAAKSWETAYEKYGETVATREEAAVMLYSHSLAKAATAAADGTDEASAPDVAKAMAWAVDAGLIRGDEAGNLNETGQLTRGQFATIIERYISLLLE